MAARWRWTHPNRNAGNNVPVATDALKAVTQGNLHLDGVGTDMQSCVDQTILAIFEDSALMSEGGAGVDDESEKLLSALTEMLDAVEDDDGNLSPFDTLPDTELLDSPTASGGSERLALGGGPGPTSLNGTVKTKTDGDKKDTTRKGRPPPLLGQQRALFCSKSSRAEAEVEVFSSSSLINLVKIMHPYCLKLHVEDGQRLSRRHAFFSQEQVWKYQRPEEGSDQEINVVSDDDDGERPEEKTFLRSVLRKENSPRKRKRVSFGAVQVSSFEDSLQAGLLEKTQTKTGEAPSDGAPTVAGPSQEAPHVSPEETAKNAEVVPLKKAKSLSLQQYRQRQRARAPPLEQPGNYTAQWPSVSGTPQELTPILRLQGPNTPDAARRKRPAAVAPASRLGAGLDPGRMRRSRTESGICSPHRLLSAPTPHPEGATKSKRSPQKKPLVSSDPPNPVVLPLPVSQASPSSPSLDSSRWSQAESSGTSVQLQQRSALLSEDQDRSHPEPAQVAPSRCSGLDPDTSLKSPPPSAAPGSARTLQSPPAASGIEASDLTSLLERFEETQAQAEGAQASTEAVGAADTLRTHLSQPGPVPKPLGSDVVVDTQTQLLTSKRPKPPSKVVQIIEPRPLPTRKTHGSLPAVSAVLPCHVSSDHDYCRPHGPPHGRASNLRDLCTDPGHVCPDTSTWNLRIRDSPETRLPGRPGTGWHTPTVSAPSGSEETTGPWPLPTPPPSPPYRARDGRRRRAHSSSSSCSSSSSSPSLSPSRSTKRHPGKRGSSSSSRSPSGSPSPRRRYRWSRSRTRGSRSRSRSTSWSRSRSPAARRHRPGEGHSSRTCRRLRTERQSRKKLKAMDERRVVYVGRICGSMTPGELRERFLQFGQVESVSLHFRETGDHYAFVTFCDVKDAFAAIDNGGKLRRPDEKPFDLCFGGRRQFCPSDYTDLDADRETDPSATSSFEDLDFDQLLKQAQGGRKRQS